MYGNLEPAGEILSTLRRNALDSVAGTSRSERIHPTNFTSLDFEIVILILFRISDLVFRICLDFGI